MWLLWSSAFEGMQPTLRQVPPRLPRFSTHVTCNIVWEWGGEGAVQEGGWWWGTFRPSCAALMAAT